ncbi:hypothetical protein L6R52_25220 [Myxococcota bacterium]|nr:hypothetical protein [Myxococcota bacterium]
MRRGSAAYRIMDEPVPGPSAHLVVSPMWPLLAGMLGGLWIGLPWLVANGQLMGSATKVKEAVVAAAGLVAVIVLSVVLATVLGDQPAGTVGKRTIGFAILGLQIVKLGLYYSIYHLQSPSFELYEHFAEKVKNGIVVVILAAFGRSVVLGLFDGLVAVLVLS